MFTRDIFQFDTYLGDAFNISDDLDAELKIIHESQTMIIRWPFGGFVWNRPSAIIIEHGEEVNRIPIIDVTRVIQFTLLGVAMMFGISMFVRALKKRRS